MKKHDVHMVNPNLFGLRRCCYVIFFFFVKFTMSMGQESSELVNHMYGSFIDIDLFLLLLLSKGKILQ